MQLTKLAELRQLRLWQAKEDANTLELELHHGLDGVCRLSSSYSVMQGFTLALDGKEDNCWS